MKRVVTSIRIRGQRPRPRRAETATFGAVAALVASLSAQTAHADPLRLRADGYAQTQGPVGLVVLRGEDRSVPWLDVEGLAWTGANAPRTAPRGATADLLTLAVRVHDAKGRAQLRAGRFLIATGAVRPIHMDGASALLRAPTGTSLETFGGMPVVPRFGERSYDWAAGGRVAQSFGARATLGLAYLQRRDRGRISDEEAGLDAALSPVRWLDIAARSAFDLGSRAPTDALMSIAARTADWRFELFGTRRSPSRMLPATSLFSVLGDVPSTRFGTTVKWKAAPRLDLLAMGVVQTLASDAGIDGTLRATLRTDDEGEGSVGVELRRQGGISGASWTGVRAIGVVPIVRGMFRASTELELVRPDDPRGRGSLWPWALVAVTWKPTKAWEIAAATEASATNTARREIIGLARASWTWGR